MSILCVFQYSSHHTSHSVGVLQVLTKIMSHVSQKKGNIFFKNPTTNGTAAVLRFGWSLIFCKILIFKGDMSLFLRHLTNYFCCTLYSYTSSPHMYALYIMTHEISHYIMFWNYVINFICYCCAGEWVLVVG